MYYVESIDNGNPIIQNSLKCQNFGVDAFFYKAASLNIVEGPVLGTIYIYTITQSCLLMFRFF